MKFYTTHLLKYLLSLFIIFAFNACSKTTPIPTESPSAYTLHLDKAHLARLNFQGKELIATKIKGQYYYVHKSGKAMPTLTYDGQADEFSDGLARTKINGKIGFFNKNLEMVLKPQYDFAFPFYKGKAEICIGCQEQDEKGTPMLDGGTWKKINRDGLVIE